MTELDKTELGVLLALMRAKARVTPLTEGLALSKDRLFKLTVIALQKELVHIDNDGKCTVTDKGQAIVALAKRHGVEFGCEVWVGFNPIQPSLRDDFYVSAELTRKVFVDIFDAARHSSSDER